MSHDERGRFRKGNEGPLTRDRLLFRAEQWLQRAQRHIADNKRFATCMREYATLLDRASRAKR